MAPPDLLSSQGLRLDGRRPNELRRIRCKLGVFTQPDGSAYLEQGNTKVLAAVYGPHQANKSKSSAEGVVVNCQYSMATFSTGERKNRPRGDRKSLEMSLHLKQALTAGIKTELYPRSQIDIYVEVLQADGGAYCACVNAATLALIDAGIPLRSYVCACTASMAARDGGSEPLLDVGHVEEAAGGVVLTIATLPSTGRIGLLELSHRLHKDYYDAVMSRAFQGCRDIEADGGAYCACVNAATLALIDAGIPLRSYVCACTASMAARDGGSEPLLDVGHVEEAAGGVVLTIATLPSTGRIGLLELSHRLHKDYYDAVMSRAFQGCRDIEVVLDRAVRAHLAEGWTQEDLVTI